MDTKMDAKLHIELNKDSRAYKWLDTQSDRIGAKGHIGTRIDSDDIQSLESIRIIIDINNTSTGKPCLVYKTY